jgi:hypothetical protein
MSLLVSVSNIHVKRQAGTQDNNARDSVIASATPSHYNGTVFIHHIVFQVSPTQ